MAETNKTIARQVVEEIIEEYQITFEGQAHLDFAMHAAFPLYLNPDLAYRIWYHFRSDQTHQFLNIPWIAVADLLLSDLCKPLGSEGYEMRGLVREILLEKLEADPRFGKTRIADLAHFMQWYAEEELNDSQISLYREKVAETQRWTALAFLDPQTAAAELGEKVNEALNTGKKSSAIRFTDLLQTLNKPLKEMGHLITFSKGVAHYLRDNKEEAQKNFDELDLKGNSFELAGIEFHVPKIDLKQTTINNPIVLDEVDIIIEYYSDNKSFALALQSRLEIENWSVFLKEKQTGISSEATTSPEPEHKLLIRMLGEGEKAQGEYKDLIREENKAKLLEINLLPLIPKSISKSAPPAKADFYWPAINDEKEFARLMQMINHKINEFDQLAKPLDQKQNPHISIEIRKSDLEQGEDLKSSLEERDFIVELAIEEEQSSQSQSIKLGQKGQYQPEPQFLSTSELHEARLIITLLGKNDLPATIGERQSPSFENRIEISLEEFTQPSIDPKSDLNIPYGQPDFAWPNTEPELDLLLAEIDYRVATVQSINRLIKSASDLDEANRLLEYLKSKGGSPNLNTYNLLIQKTKSLKNARKWFNTLIESKVDPSLESFHLMIRKAADFHAASNWISDLYEQGIKPVIETYNLVFLKTDAFEQAQRLFEEMRSSEVQPNLATFHVLIEKTENRQHRNWAFDEMAKDGQNPDLKTFELLMDNSIDFKEAQDWFVRMEAMGYLENLSPKSKMSLLKRTDKGKLNPQAETWIEEKRERFNQENLANENLPLADISTFGFSRQKEEFNAWLSERWLPTIQPVLLYGNVNQGAEEFIIWMEQNLRSRKMVTQSFNVEFWKFEQLSNLKDSFDSFFMQKLKTEAKTLAEYLQNVNDDETQLFIIHLTEDQWLADGLDRLFDYLVDLNIAFRSKSNQPKLWIFPLIQWKAQTGAAAIKFISQSAEKRRVNRLTEKAEKSFKQYRELYSRMLPQFHPVQMEDISNWLIESEIEVSGEEITKKYFRGLKKVNGGWNYNDAVQRLSLFLQKK